MGARNPSACGRGPAGSSPRSGDEAHNPYPSLCFTRRGTGYNTNMPAGRHDQFRHGRHGAGGSPRMITRGPLRDDCELSQVFGFFGLSNCAVYVRLESIAPPLPAIAIHGRSCTIVWLHLPRSRGVARDIQSSTNFSSFENDTTFTQITKIVIQIAESPGKAPPAYAWRRALSVDYTAFCEIMRLMGSSNATSLEQVNNHCCCGHRVLTQMQHACSKWIRMNSVKLTVVHYR